MSKPNLNWYQKRYDYATARKEAGNMQEYAHMLHSLVVDINANHMITFTDEARITGGDALWIYHDNLELEYLNTIAELEEKHTANENTRKIKTNIAYNDGFYTLYLDNEEETNLLVNDLNQKNYKILLYRLLALIYNEYISDVEPLRDVYGLPELDDSEPTESGQILSFKEFQERQDVLEAELKRWKSLPELDDSEEPEPTGQPEPTESGQGDLPIPLPPKIDTPRTRAAFKAALDVGFIKATKSGYQWIPTYKRPQRALAYFCRELLAPSDEYRLPISTLEKLFGVKNLSKTRDSLKYLAQYKQQQWQIEIDNLLSQIPDE